MFAIMLCAFLQSSAFAQKTICINGVCYPVVSETVVKSSQAVVEADSQALIPRLKSDSVKFRRSLLAAARQSHQSGAISLGQYFAIINASRKPAVLAELQSSVHEYAIEEGVASATAIDWDKLIGVIEKLIPIIIQLIGMFK